MTPRATVAYCGLLMSISAFSIDIMLPAFPAMVDDLAAAPEEIQWTITAYILGAGLAQLCWGAASDRFGRRPILAAGLATFAAGCLVCALAPSPEVLLLGRVVQGLGASAAIVNARAMVRDLFSGESLARNMSLAVAIFSVGPIVAPLLGAGLEQLFGWRAIFVALLLFSTVLLAMLVKLPETLRMRSREATAPRVMAARAARLLRHPQSRHFLLLSIVVMSTMLLILSALPRLYEAAFGISGMAFAVLFALHGFGIVVGQWANRRLIRRIGLLPATLCGGIVLAVSSGAMTASLLAGGPDVTVMTALVVLFATSYLIVFSNASALVLDPHGDIAGFAAAAFGFTSQFGSALVVSVIVVLMGSSVFAFASTLFALCAAVVAGTLAWQRRLR